MKGLTLMVSMIIQLVCYLRSSFVFISNNAGYVLALLTATAAAYKCGAD